MLNLLNRFSVFILVLVVSRLALLGLLVFITHGREISNDVAMHIEMIQNPLCILRFTCPGYDQYPPLLPIFETLFGTPVNFFFSSVITIRLTMILYEVMTAVVFFKIVKHTVNNPVWRAYLFASFIALPMMFMTSTIMGAHTMIGGTFVTVGAWLAIRSNANLASFVMGLGTIAAKQFLVLPLLVTVLVENRSNWIRRAVAGFLPIAIVFGGLVLWRILNGQQIPLSGFKPDPYFGTNFWVALRTIHDIDISPYGTFSGVLALSLAFIPIALGYFKAAGPMRNDAILMSMAASLILFFSFFYHVNPDYFVICMPLLIALSRSLFDLICVWLVGITPWIGKFLQLFVFKDNVGNEMVGGKAVILNAFHPKLMDYAETALITNQLLFSALTIFVGFALCVRIVKLKSA